ncbi:hypothetical protein OEG84_08730 [Hoeflea sp. G2-23]|uniref:Uncharacterized protein n=1 Tax=Hoeflea algicola TaxID=2983763 RepID=A0ABT3Z814_9HYPH|nr:hypothetical protein [Hoeflea algicola]MCY0147798.1 hypothetical protein [Hoeflea algicola]
MGRQIPSQPAQKTQRVIFAKDEFVESCIDSDMVDLSDAPRLIHQEPWVLYQRQQCYSCGAAFNEVAEVRNGPKVPMRRWQLRVENGHFQVMIVRKTFH